MKIGFYFECSTKSGGAYQYAFNMIETLAKIPEHEYVVFNISPDFPYHLAKLPNWKVIDIIPVVKKQNDSAENKPQNTVQHASFKRRFNLFILEGLRKLHLYRLNMFLTSINAKRRAEKFSKFGIDLMIYHGPSELSFLTKIPGIVPIHDIEHRLHKNEFPELSDLGQWAKREYLYKNIAKRAWRILVDSEISKEDVAREYGVATEKISIVPFIPAMYLKKDISEEAKASVRAKFNLPEKFIYYPAQFWPHKNHRGLIEAIALLKEKGLIVNVVFTGGTQDLWGEYERIKKLIAERELDNQVKFLGFVNALEISAIYKMAEAMVMPVLMGPTFIPVYEAWFMDCPVLYSDIRGPREQAGNAALLFNPHSPAKISSSIEKIWKNETLRQNLIAKGKERLSKWTQKDFYDKIRSIIIEFEKSYGK